MIETDLPLDPGENFAIAAFLRRHDEQKLTLVLEHCSDFLDHHKVDQFLTTMAMGEVLGHLRAEGREHVAAALQFARNEKTSFNLLVGRRANKMMEARVFFGADCSITFGTSGAL